jgi:Abnormal spindle-like microcephaly-assoc'd, ASPM-SPD-2-Hydin/Right handed beta helix region
MGCAGYAEPRGFLSVSPSSVSITTAVGTSNSQTVSVSNNSHATINVTQAQVTGSGFSAQNLSLPVTIAPGQSLNITVKYTPSSSKSVDGMLMLMTDHQFRPVMARLHGSTGAASPSNPSSPAVSSVAVSPAIASTTTGGKVQFTSTVDGTTTDKDVTWTATSGSVSSSGAFTAASSAGTAYVTATSVADSTKKSTAAVTVSTATKPTSPTPTPTVSSVAVSPTSTSTKTGTSVQFTANVQGTVTDKSVTWKAVLGSVSGSGVYTAPTKAGTDTVTATSNADPTMSAKSTVSISAATAAPTVSSVSVSPASASSTTSGTLQFSASVQGTVTDKSVTWHASLGTISASGAYTAPSKAGADTVTATSNADTSKVATASVSVSAPPAATVTSVSVSPASTSATTGGTLQFSASVQGTTTNKAVTWRASLGSITSSGVYTAPAKAGTDTVVATSSFDSSKSASASVSVTAPAPSQPSQPSQPSANTVSLSTFGNVGFGGDDTSVFQTALNSTASNAEVLEIPAGNYNISPLNIPSNSNIKVDSGVTVSANSGYGSSDRMLNINSKNVTITGAGANTSVFQMPKARSASQGDGSQYRHCLSIQNASNVTVTGIACNQSGGDGIYISAASTVTVSNCVFDQNFRDGGSFIGQLSNVNITNNTFSNSNGSLPQAGVDIEPNVPSDFISGLNLTDNTMKGNTGDGLAISLWTLTSASQPVSITVTRNHSDSNGRYGYYMNNNDPSNASGTITLNDCTTDSSASDGANARFYAANGASVTFNNLTVTNPHRNGPDPSYGDSAAVAIIRGGGGTVAEGNVHYVNTNIQATNGELEYYFEFQDNSNVGVSNVTFTPGTLSGAKASANGLLNGQTTNSVN